MAKIKPRPDVGQVDPNDVQWMPGQPISQGYYDPNQMANNAANYLTNYDTRARWTLYDKLAMRLNIDQSDSFGFDNGVSILSGDTKVFVFVAHGDKAAIIEEENGKMFPSDAFLARFHLVRDEMVGPVTNRPPVNMVAQIANAQQLAVNTFNKLTAKGKFK